MEEEVREPEFEIDEKKVEEWFKSKFCGKAAKKQKVKNVYKSRGGIWCFGFIGAAIYYIGAATTFWIGVLGVLKAIVWPVFLVYELLKFLGA